LIYVRWTIFTAITLATALLFLALVVIVWENGHGLKVGQCKDCFTSLDMAGDRQLGLFFVRSSF
jgi:hypothetical protein